jgi:hypothetical protein
MLRAGPSPRHLFMRSSRNQSGAFQSSEAPLDFAGTPGSFLQKSKTRKARTMRGMVAKVFMVIAFTAIGALGADSYLGTWKYNAEKSKSTLTNPYKDVIDVRTATPDGGFQFTRTARRMDGTVEHGSYTCKYDGKECSVTGLPYDTISIRRIDANTVENEVRKKNGKYHAIARHTVSKDGKTLTQTATGTDAEGKAFSQTRVYEKQ